MEVSVTDMRVGVAKEFLKNIFEKFYQIKSNKSGKPDGAGIGFSVASEITKLHNGRIWVESEIGNGSVAKFVLLCLS